MLPKKWYNFFNFYIIKTLSKEKITFLYLWCILHYIVHITRSCASMSISGTLSTERFWAHVNHKKGTVVLVCHPVGKLDQSPTSNNNLVWTEWNINVSEETRDDKNIHIFRWRVAWSAHQVQWWSSRTGDWTDQNSTGRIAQDIDRRRVLNFRTTWL